MTAPALPWDRRYPLGALLTLGLTRCENLSEVLRRLNISGTTYADYRDRGLGWRSADTLAGRLGFLPWEVWPQWLDDSIEEAELIGDPETRSARLSALQRHRDAWRESAA